jgi:hypothetical protein
MCWLPTQGKKNVSIHFYLHPACHMILVLHLFSPVCFFSVHSKENCRENCALEERIALLSLPLSSGHQSSFVEYYSCIIYEPRALVISVLETFEKFKIKA